MNRRFFVISVASVAVAVFAGGAALYKSATPEVAPTPTALSTDASLIRMHSPIIGNAGAPVSIVEFFDPSCEACRAFYPIVKQIMAQVGGEVRLVLRYTTLHEGSDEVVRILEAARKQNKFEPVLEALLAGQPEWAIHGEPDIERAWRIAGTAGIDVGQARLDAKTTAVDNVLAQDAADVRTNKVEQTPTFFVNGKPLTDFSPQGLLNLVESEVAVAKTGS